jgi:hypothetical protein
MARSCGYLFIESRDPWDSADARRFRELAITLSRTHGPVTFFLVQNGVGPARAGAEGGGLEELRRAGVQVLADELSLRERGITAERLDARVTAASLDVVIDGLADGKKVLWH